MTAPEPPRGLSQEQLDELLPRPRPEQLRLPLDKSVYGCLGQALVILSVLGMAAGLFALPNGGGYLFGGAFILFVHGMLLCGIASILSELRDRTK